MVIKVQPTFNAIKPSSDPTTQNPALARRTGEAIADVGTGVSSLGSMLSKVAKGTNEIERQNAKKEAANYVESEYQKLLASGGLSEEEFASGENPYDILKKKLRSIKVEYLTENNKFEQDVSITIDEVLNSKTAPLAQAVGKKHFALASERFRKTHLVTENMIRETPSMLADELNSLPKTVEELAQSDLDKLIKSNPAKAANLSEKERAYLDATGRVIEKGMVNKTIDERAVAYITAATQSLADSGDDSKAIEVLRSHATYIDKTTTDKLEDDLRKRATYARTKESQQLKLTEMRQDKKDLENDDSIRRASLNAQLSGDMTKALEIESNVLKMAASGKVSPKVFDSINKQERFNYQELDPKSEYMIANMVSSGSNANAVREKVNFLVDKGMLSSKSAIKWLNAVKSMQVSEKDTYFSQGMSAINTMFGDEKVLGDILNTTLDPQRRLKVQATEEYIQMISNPNFKGTAMEAAKAVIARHKGSLPVVPLTPASEQSADVNVSIDAAFRLQKAKEEGWKTPEEYKKDLELYLKRKEFEKSRDDIKEGVEVLKRNAKIDEELHGIVPYQDAESKAKAQAEMMGR